MSCPNEKNPCKINENDVSVSISIHEPYPSVLLFSISWQEADILPTNCLKMLLSLPPYVYPSNLFETPSIDLTYKLNGIVAFTGSHYLIFLRVFLPDSNQKSWTLFNDTEILPMGDFGSVAKYLVDGNMVPTLLIYERSEYIPAAK
jgi:hypothetical protein